MEKQYNLCFHVLKRFQDVEILKDLILIGSWCLYFYTAYFEDVTFTPTIRTRDIDFLIPTPVRIKNKVDVAELLKDEGFVITFSGEKGYMKLLHPELIVEFLVPEKGKGTDKAYPLPQLGMNAQPLRFLDLLIQNEITLTFNSINIRVPHPGAFGLHKLIISERRKDEEKMLKDRQEGLLVLNTLVKKNEADEIRKIFNEMPSSWRKKTVTILKKTGSNSIVDILIEK